MSPMYKPNGMMPGKMPKMPKMMNREFAERDRQHNTGLASRLMDSDKWRLLKMRYCRS